MISVLSHVLDVIVGHLKHLLQPGRKHKPLQAHSLAVLPAGHVGEEPNILVPLVGRFELFAKVLDLLQPLVAAGLEKHLQDVLPLRGAGRQELAKLPLRKHHHLPELLALEAQKLLYRPIYVPHAICNGPSVFRPRVRFGPVVKRGFLALIGRPVSPLLGKGLLRAAPQAVPLLPEAEVEGHLRRLIEAGKVAPHLASAALVSGGFSVEGKADRVQQARLAGPRWPVNQKELLGAQRLKVHGLRLRVRAKLVENETFRGHV